MLSFEIKGNLTMCVTCQTLHRRGFLALSAASLVVASGAASPGFAATTMSPDEALDTLIEGNKRFRNAPQMCEVDMARKRAAMAKGQSPWATILACSDSRVSPELVFGGVGIGALFVARNAGNMADQATLGTIEYGAEHLGSPLIVVLGHQNCGAVSAACEVVERHTRLPGSMGPMIQAIVP